MSVQRRAFSDVKNTISVTPSFHSQVFLFYCITHDLLGCP